MNIPDESITVINSMKASELNNYIIPGLTSHLLTNGKVRMFTHDRAQQHSITPHSHRFDFTCLVLKGSVRQRIWLPAQHCVAGSRDKYFVSAHKFTKIGEYPDVKIVGETEWGYQDNTHTQGEWYSMKHDEIHSIYFGRDTQVLFFEGPQVSEVSLILEPSVNGVRVPTFEVRDWMFNKGETK